MSELRFDPVKKIWSVIASDRSRRPEDFLVRRLSPVSHGSSACPFCPGNEHSAGQEIFSITGPDGKWQTRVVPNRYPAFRIEGDLVRSAHGMYDSVTGIGAHEVVIETPDHGINLGSYTDRVLKNVFIAFRERIIDLKKDTRFRYIMPFKNYGVLAGAGIDHPHSQIIALPVTPGIVKTKLASALEHYRLKERCIFCDMLAQEISEGTRIVYENQDFVALCPYASSIPFETVIFPKRHSHCFTRADDTDLSALADIVREIFGRMYRCLEEPPLNMVLHTAPPAVKRPSQPGYWLSIEQDFHWHIEITPRLTAMAGFESGTGFYINPVSPESAAEFLKGAVQ